jgi:hypothetical protein
MKAYFVFFLPKGVPAQPIAIYFDKKKAYDHMKTANREYVELRITDWTEGILPCMSETSYVDVPEPKPKKKKEAEPRNMTNEEKKLTSEFVLSKFDNKENNKNESDNRIPVT